MPSPSGVRRGSAYCVKHCAALFFKVVFGFTWSRYVQSQLARVVVCGLLVCKVMFGRVQCVSLFTWALREGGVVGEDEGLASNERCLLPPACPGEVRILSSIARLGSLR